MYLSMTLRSNKSDGQAPMELLLHGYCNWRLSALYRSAVVSLTLPDINHLLLVAAMLAAAMLAVVVLV